MINNARTVIVFVIFLLMAGMGTNAFAVGESHKAAGSPKVKIPATVDEVFKAVDERLGGLEKNISANELNKVHTLAFEIRDLIQALPEKAVSLPSKDKTALTSSVSKIKQQAGLLDKFGDAGDAAQTQAVFAKFKAEIGKIKELLGIKP